MKRVAVYIDHKHYFFPGVSLFFNLLGKVRVKKSNWVCLQSSDLYVSHVLLVHHFQSFCLPGTGSVGNN
jgi:hypothetical protein